MHVRGIVEEDFVNYKVPSMFINSCWCDFKCCTEIGLNVEVCQNAPLVQGQIKEIPDDVIYNHFTHNLITKAVVIGGMEPMLQIKELLDLIRFFRDHNENSLFVIYTGYNKEEITEQLEMLKQFPNIIVKFGRFRPNQNPHYDEVLGINLISDNQFAEKIS